MAGSGTWDVIFDDEPAPGLTFSTGMEDPFGLAEASDAYEATGLDPSVFTYVGQETYKSYNFYYNSNLAGYQDSWNTATFSLNECFSDASKEMAFTPISQTTTFYGAFAYLRHTGYQSITIGKGYSDVGSGKLPSFL